MRILMCAAVVCAALCNAESFDTVVQRIVYNYNVADSINATIPNIGQSQHQITFVYSNDSPSICSAAGFVSLFIEGSQDQTNWVRISPFITPTTDLGGNSYTGTILASNAWASLRLSRGAVPSGCKLTAWYTGALPAPGLPQLLMAPSAGYLRDRVTVTSPGTYQLRPPQAATSRMVLYGFWVFNANDPTNNVWVFEAAGSCGGVKSSTIFQRTMPSNTEYARPASLVPYHVGSPNQWLCVTTTTAVQVDVEYVYRVE